MTTLVDLPGQLTSSWFEALPLVGHNLEPPYRTSAAIGSPLTAGDHWQLSRFDAIGIGPDAKLLRSLTEGAHAFLIDGFEQEVDVSRRLGDTGEHFLAPVPGAARHPEVVTPHDLARGGRVATFELLVADGQYQHDVATGPLDVFAAERQRMGDRDRVAEVDPGG